MRKTKNALSIIILLVLVTTFTMSCVRTSTFHFDYNTTMETAKRIYVVYVHDDRSVAMGHPVNYDTLHEFLCEEKNEILLGLSQIEFIQRFSRLGRPYGWMFGIAIKIVQDNDRSRFIFYNLMEMFNENGHQISVSHINCNPDDFHSLISQFVDISDFI